VPGAGGHDYDAPAEAALLELRALWERERDSGRRQVREERLRWSLSERVERGLSLRDLVLDDTEASAGDRVLLWLRRRLSLGFDELRMSPGEPVRLWSKDPDGDEVESGVVARIEAARIGVMVSAEYAEFIDHGAFALDREAPEVSFERAARAIATLRSGKPGSVAGKWRRLLYGGEPVVLPHAQPLSAADAHDSGLNASQLAAVGFALAAPDIALIHGPPGTGKTRTLVELVRQALRREERVLVTAASHAAVDNLAERLVAAGVPVLRLGHPARVAEGLLDSTLDAKLDRSPARRLARRLTAEAVDLRRRIQRRKARGNLDFREARDMRDEAKRLMREARAQLDLARELIFAEARVVCVTAAGAEPSLLAAFEFDRVVLDEATQAVDPIALVALLQAGRAVLAGDPRQLPPTVIDPEVARAGLSRTLFERLIEQYGERLVRLLDVQYRMPEALMRFPSQSMYEGKLTAAPEVRDQLLSGLSVRADPARPGPLVFLDTAGMGFSEERSDDDPSTKNPGQAERVAVEVERLLARGLPARSLGVITPYHAQVRVLRERLQAACEQGLEIASVDGFQGREKEAIVLDLVRSNDAGDLGFLRDVRRMNVALTRARRFLLVVGDSATLARDSYYRAFIESAEAQGALLSAWADDGVWVGEEV
jgi:ABC-type branched-subunit amino acid transport system ATPase component